MKIWKKKTYIAKKILLGNLKEKEQTNCKNEVKFLRDLHHPNIVTYKESLIEDGMLIIIMEYCEEGDLGFHIKRKIAKNEHFPENVILNWFLQILLALTHVHGKHIIHRDIKTTNIFLTSNGTVKLGDFGISKILENTEDVANTVVGTPYYMSPEVCQSHPYTYQSDIWALGVVLYELCALRRPFEGTNLLNLVYKIVKERAEPVTNLYSKELNALIERMLDKDEHTRITIKDIYSYNFIQKNIKEFIDSKGQNAKIDKVPIKKTLTHQEFKNLLKNESEFNLDNNIKTEKGKLVNETPLERLRRKKEEEAKKRQQELNIATRENLINKSQHKQKKVIELQGWSENQQKEILNDSNVMGKNVTKSPSKSKIMNDNQIIPNESKIEAKANQTSKKNFMKDENKFLEKNFEDTGRTISTQLFDESVVWNPNPNLQPMISEK